MYHVEMLPSLASYISELVSPHLLSVGLIVLLKNKKTSQNKPNYAHFLLFVLH